MSTFLSAAAPRASFERHLTRREERHLLAHIAKHAGHYAKRDHAWIRLARHTGMRLGSLRHFTCGDARTALSTRRVSLSSEFAKRHHGYDLPLNSGAEQALRDALKVRRAMGLVEDPDAALFCSMRGGAMAERTYQQRMQMWRESAGLSVAASPHWLRHTFAKRVQANTEHRDPQGVVQALLGHANRASTVIYTLPDREDLERAAEDACQ